MLLPCLQCKHLFGEAQSSFHLSQCRPGTIISAFFENKALDILYSLMCWLWWLVCTYQSWLTHWICLMNFVSGVEWVLAALYRFCWGQHSLFLGAFNLLCGCSFDLHSLLCTGLTQVLILGDSYRRNSCTACCQKLVPGTLYSYIHMELAALHGAKS